MPTTIRSSILFIALLLTACSMEQAGNTESDFMSVNEEFNSCDSFFASTELRDRYASPLNERVCLIEAESDAPILYAERSGVTWHDGVPVELYASVDGEHVAMRSAFHALAAETGALPAGDSAGEVGTAAQPVIAAGIALGVRACARSMGCRMTVARLGKVAIEGLTISSIAGAGYEVLSWFE